MYSVKEDFKVEYVPSESVFYITYFGHDNIIVGVSIRDIDNGLTLYYERFHFVNGLSYWISLTTYPRYNMIRGVDVEFYDENNTLLFFKKCSLNGRFVFNDAPFKSLLCSFYYEFTIDANYCEIDESDVVLDLGANLGAFSAFCLEKGCKRIIAVEADPVSADILAKNFKYYDNVTVLNFAVSDSENEKIPFYVEPIDRIGSSLLPIDNSEVVEINTITIGGLMKRYDLSKISVLKMDIEGVEFDVLASLSDDILNSIDVMIVEFHYSTEEKITRVLDRLRTFFTFNTEQVPKENMFTIRFVKIDSGKVVTGT